MTRLTLTKTALLAPLAAAAALSLTACVAPNPYGAYGAQPQYAQPAYAQVAPHALGAGPCDAAGAGVVAASRGDL